MTSSFADDFQGKLINDLPKMVDIIVYSNIIEQQTSAYESLTPTPVAVLDTKEESVSRCSEGFISSPRTPGGPNVCPGNHSTPTCLQNGSTLTEGKLCVFIVKIKQFHYLYCPDYKGLNILAGNG